MTGASPGIGAAAARLAGERGYAVAVNFSTGKEEANKVVVEIVAVGGRALPIQADVSREEEILRMFETAGRELGPIKGLVNNAGVTSGEPERLQRLMPSIPMRRAGLPEEVAEAVLWLLSPAASYTTGAILEVGSGR